MREYHFPLSRETQSQEIEASLKENFKLSSYEARAYLSLLKLGRQNSKQLASSAGVPLPRIYDTLDSLMQKGFLVKQEENFSAIPPRQALKGRSSQFEAQFSNEQKRRKQAEDQLISALDEENAASQNQGTASSEISILKGLNAIINKFAELIEDSEDTILVAKRAVDARQVFIPILLETPTLREERQLSKKQAQRKRNHIRIITPINAKISKEELEEAKKAGAEIRRSDNIVFDMMITDRDDVIIGVPDPLSEEINHAIAIWVRNPSFAKSTRSAIEEIWKSSEKA